MTGIENSLSMALFWPVVVLAAIWGVLTVSSQVVEGRGDTTLSSSLADLGFAALLGAGAWCVVMLIASLVSFPSRVSTLVVVVVVVGVFFAILAGLLLVMTEMRIRGRLVGAYVVGLLGVLVVLGILALIFL